MNKLIKHIFKGIFAFSILFLVFSNSSCRKLVETDPPSDRFTGTNVFLADGTAIGVLNGIYGHMGLGRDLQGDKGLALLTGLSGDELTNLYQAFPFPSYYTNDLVGKQGTVNAGTEFWPKFYALIYKCNDA